MDNLFLIDVVSYHRSPPNLSLLDSANNGSYNGGLAMDEVPVTDAVKPPTRPLDYFNTYSRMIVIDLRDTKRVLLACPEKFNLSPIKSCQRFLLFPPELERSHMQCCTRFLAFLACQLRMSQHQGQSTRLFMGRQERTPPATNERNQKSAMLAKKESLSMQYMC